MPELARVTGTLWATAKDPRLAGSRMQWIQPIDSAGRSQGQPLVAVDTVGAGPGDTVLYVTAYEAVIPLPVDLVPIDASIIGIVDAVQLQERP